MGYSSRPTLNDIDCIRPIGSVVRKLADKRCDALFIYVVAQAIIRTIRLKHRLEGPFDTRKDCFFS